jgi:hypothetical protein
MSPPPDFMVRMGVLAPLVLAMSVACGSKGQRVGDATDGPASDGHGLSDRAQDATAAPWDVDFTPDVTIVPVDAPASTCSEDAGCAAGETCWLTPSGARACARFTEPPAGPVPGASCDPGPLPGDQPPPRCCTDDRQCTELPRGRCVAQTFCGGMARKTWSVCQYGVWCTADADCRQSGSCLPPPFSGTSWPQCLAGFCRTSADCTRRPGGECVLDRPSGSCATRFASLYCRYPGDVCRAETAARDCHTDGGVPTWACIPGTDGHGTRCVIDPPPPP